MRRWHSLVPAVFVATALGSMSCSPQAPKSVNSTKNSPTKTTANTPTNADTPGADKEKPVQATTKTASASDPGQSLPPDPSNEYRDPAWFNAGIFPGAKVVKRSRSQRDDDGFYTSQYLFELTAGTTEEQCVQRLQEISEGVVNELKVTKEASRSKLSGSADSYTVTHVCGATPEGAMRSLVSYRWTRPPNG